MSHHMTLSPTPLTSGLAGQVTSTKRGITAKDTTTATGATSDPSTATSAPANSTSSLDTTFLSLLVQELQNQDPTAPMDSTAMVGQMISLNQLDQLTSINQTLSTAYGSTSTSSGAASGATSATGSGATSATGTGTQAHTLSATQAALRLLSSTSTVVQPAVSPSVSLPAF